MERHRWEKEAVVIVVIYHSVMERHRWEKEAVVIVVIYHSVVERHRWEKEAVACCYCCYLPQCDGATQLGEGSCRLLLFTMV